MGCICQEKGWTCHVQGGELAASMGTISCNARGHIKTGKTWAQLCLLAAFIQLTWSEGDEWAPCCSDRQDACQVNQVCIPA